MALPQLRDWLLAPYSEDHSRSTSLLHRKMLVISGHDKFCDTTLSVVNKYVEEASYVTLTRFTGETLKGKSRKKVLGSESDIAILDCRDMFKPGDVMAVSGTVKRGGCLILVCPTLDKWPRNVSVSFVSHGFTLSHSRYLARFIKCLFDDESVAFFSETVKRLPSLHHYEADKSRQEAYRGSLFQSQQQEHAYNQLCQAHSLNKLNAVITAPRGRGKSSLLGLFIQKLLREGKRVLLTSELFENVKNVMARLEAHGYTEGSPTNHLAQADNRHTTQGVVQTGFVKWVPPDSELLFKGNSDERDYDIVIVDEAASFPLPIVSNIIAHNNQWILSTTMLGYEGSGSGFLHKLIPNLHSTSLFLGLSTPLRWLEGDPIEAFFNRTCLFENDGIDDQRSFVTLKDVIPEDESIGNQAALPAFNDVMTENKAPAIHDIKALADKWIFNITSFNHISEEVLTQVMSLLSLAHYQTTPDDFMRLMDSPDVLVATLQVNSQVLCAAVINIEGGKYLEKTAEDIACGKRRPKGHLGAQRLTVLSANPTAATHSYWRINRIAVNTGMQNKGVGSALIKKLVHAAYRRNIDGLCTSYGTTKALNSFWKRNGFDIVDYGRKPNKASGETSALAVKALSTKVKSLIVDVNALRDSYLHTSTFTQLSPNVIAVYDKKLNDFVFARRTLDDVWPILNKLASFSESIKNGSLEDGVSTMPKARLMLVIELFNEQFKLKEVFEASHFATEPLFEVLNANGLKDASQKLRDKLKAIYH